MWVLLGVLAMRSHHHHLSPKTTSSLASLMTGNGMRRVGMMCESWITPRFSVGGWIGDSAFHKVGNRKGLEVEGERSSLL